jgi:hypothetical protein
LDENFSTNSFPIEINRAQQRYRERITLKEVGKPRARGVPFVLVVES